MKQKLLAAVLLGIIIVVYYRTFADDKRVDVSATVAAPAVVPTPMPPGTLIQIRPSVPVAVAQEEAVPRPISPARQRYLDLADDYSRLLNDEELELEAKRLEAHIAQRTAERRLDNVRDSLQKLIEEFPQSNAAVRAKRMLDAYPKSDGGVYDTPRTFDSEPEPFNADPQPSKFPRTTVPLPTEP